MSQQNQSLLELVGIAGQFFGYAIVGVAGFFLVKFKRMVEERAKYPIKTIEASHRVRELMTEVRAAFDADRVKIFQFKNGEYFNGGASEQKLVITHVVSRVGVGATEGIMRFQTLPVTLAGTWLKRATSQDVELQQVDDIDPDSMMKDFFLMNGTSTTLSCKLMKNRQLIGLLVLTWMDPIKTKPKADQLHELRSLIALIAKLLA